jgi:hypothetical protein
METETGQKVTSVDEPPDSPSQAREKYGLPLGGLRKLIYGAPLKLISTVAHTQEQTLGKLSFLYYNEYMYYRTTRYEYFRSIFPRH